MQNFIELPTSNAFEEKSNEFNQSKLAQRLKAKYTPKPFEENYKPVYWLALVGSYFCNLFSILTASTFIFSYLFSIFVELPYPIWWAAFFSGIILILIEGLQRILTPKLFGGALQYGIKASSFVLAGIILSISSLSICFSYNGGFDVVDKLLKPPTYQAPTLQNIEAIRKEYKALIIDTDADAKDYRDRKLYLGKLADKHAKAYKQLLDKKASLQNQMILKINKAEETNNSLLADTKEEHAHTIAAYNKSVTSKGGGLAAFALFAQFIFFASMFFLEFFDYKTASQYALISIPQNHFQKIDNGNNTTNETPFNKHAIRNQIGYQNKPAKRSNPLLQHKQTPQTKTVIIADKHTIEHKGKRYTLKDVNNFINIYNTRVKEAKKKGKFDLAQSRSKTLNYWKQKQNELSNGK